MPVEVLEKIIAFAMPDDAKVIIWSRGETRILPREWAERSWLQWYPMWLPGLLLVSKAIRHAARKGFLECIKLELLHAPTVVLPESGSSTKKNEAREYFEALWPRGE
jgi:hypothetical protein